MKKDSFFEWGIPMLDSGFTSIPTPLCRSWRLIMSVEEWLFICLLASLKDTSLRAMADGMGYADEREVQLIIDGMVERGLIEIVEQGGGKNVVDFEGAWKQAVAAESQGR